MTDKILYIRLPKEGSAENEIRPIPSVAGQSSLAVGICDRVIATTGNGLLDKIAVITHYGLYVLVILMAASGIAMSLQAGLPAIVFGGSGTPLPESFAIYGSRLAHGVISKLLLALATLHVLAALYHQFVRRDKLLSRMWFGRSEPDCVGRRRAAPAQTRAGSSRLPGHRPVQAFRAC